MALSLSNFSFAQFASLKWSWTSSSTLPTSLNVISTPLVADLDLDGYPEIVFISTATTLGYDCYQGNIRVLRGTDGSEVFTIVSHPVMEQSTPAIGDIDGDGYPEIIAVAPFGGVLGECLLAFDHSGALKWKSDLLEHHCGMVPSLVDLDGDGLPEIVIGRQVVSNTGHLLWTGTGGMGSTYIHFASSYAADVDLDGNPEIVAGNTVYRRDGSILWQAAIPDGYTAVLNTNTDPYPEIVHVAVGNIRMLDHNGVLIWGPVAIPGADGYGGPPMVADLDGDGKPEIGVSASSMYTVFEANGSIRWSTPMQDFSSRMCSSSAFDFDGDCKSEIVHRDETALHVFDGSSGAVLFSVALSSGTYWEYPVVADVDRDGEAEIITGANQVGALGAALGLFVYGSNGTPWQESRAIWNEYNYRITNVEDSGAIPPVAPNSWTAHNTFRAQKVIRGPFADCNANGIPDQCDIANGISGDCNANAIPDDCDIAIGTSADCNTNGTPDECEPDCNHNGVADSCDIATGTSKDCNSNGVPDECDIASGTSQDCQPDGIPDECQLGVPSSIIVEGFDNISSLAGAGWVRINRSSPVGTNEWFQGDSSKFSAYNGTPSAYIAVNYNSAGDGSGSDTNSVWLLTPPVTLNNGFGFAFFTRTIGGSAYPDRLEVRMSRAGSSTNVGSTATSVGDFTDLLLTVNPNLTVGGYPETWTRFNTLLAGFASPTQGRLAFHYYVTDGGPSGANANYIGIDDVRLVSPPGSNDANGNGIPDECEIVIPPGPLSDPSGIDKTRFISFSVPAAATAAVGETALRVSLVALHHVSPGYTGGTSVPFTLFEGQAQYVGPPALYRESGSSQPATDFYASQLQCAPYYQNWSTITLLHVTGEAIVPSSIYQVENLAASCMGNEASCTAVSVPLEIKTTRWADVDAPYQDPLAGPSQPDFTDIGALKNKFASAIGAAIKARALLSGDIGTRGLIDISAEVNFSDISLCVDAFQGKPYPYKPGKCTGDPNKACISDVDCTNAPNPTTGPCILCP